jgi:hypothetical protein
MSETKKPLKVLLGNRIAISSDWMPDVTVGSDNKTESGIIISPEDQKQVDQEKLQKGMEQSDRFKIVQLGTEVNELFDIGQEILIEKAINVLKGSEAIVENHKIIAFIVPERAIAGIY